MLYLLFAGDKRDDKEGGTVTADDREVCGEEATTEELAPVKGKGEDVRGKRTLTSDRRQISR